MIPFCVRMINGKAIAEVGPFLSLTVKEIDVHLPGAATADTAKVCSVRIRTALMNPTDFRNVRERQKLHDLTYYYRHAPDGLNFITRRYLTQRKAKKIPLAVRAQMSEPWKTEAMPIEGVLGLGLCMIEPHQRKEIVEIAALNLCGMSQDHDQKRCDYETRAMGRALSDYITAKRPNAPWLNGAQTFDTIFRPK